MRFWWGRLGRRGKFRLGRGRGRKGSGEEGGYFALRRKKRCVGEVLGCEWGGFGEVKNGRWGKRGGGGSKMGSELG